MRVRKIVKFKGTGISKIKTRIYVMLFLIMYTYNQHFMF